MDSGHPPWEVSRGGSGGLWEQLLFAEPPGWARVEGRGLWRVLRAPPSPPSRVPAIGRRCRAMGSGTAARGGCGPAASVSSPVTGVGGPSLKWGGTVATQLYQWGAQTETLSLAGDETAPGTTRGWELLGALRECG